MIREVVYSYLKAKGKAMRKNTIVKVLGIVEEENIKRAIDLLRNEGYMFISLFVLVNYNISFDDCIYKLAKIKRWGCAVDDCTYNTTK